MLQIDHRNRLCTKTFSVKATRVVAGVAGATAALALAACSSTDQPSPTSAAPATSSVQTIQECPPGYSAQGNLCFGVRSITPGVEPEGSQPTARQKNCTPFPAKWTSGTWTSPSTITNTNSTIEPTRDTVGGSVKVEGEGSVPLIGAIKAAVEGNHQQNTDTTWIDTNTQRQTVTDSNSLEFTITPGTEITAYAQYTDVSWEIVRKYPAEKVADGHTYIVESGSYRAFEDPADCTPPGR